MSVLEHPTNIKYEKRFLFLGSFPYHTFRTCQDKINLVIFDEFNRACGFRESFVNVLGFADIELCFDNIWPKDWNLFMRTRMSGPRILVMAGEASGDYHLAALIGELRQALPEMEVFGIGGDRLGSMGVHLFHHYKEINTIGLSGGFSKLRKVIDAYRTMKNELTTGNYDLFIPVDFPDVNIRLCKFAKKSGIRVCYYISPQVWAWRKGRIFKIKERVDTMMTIFPFEEQLYKNIGVNAHFVGHTLLRDSDKKPDRHKSRFELGLDSAPWLVTLAPGSRTSEIERTLPLMLMAAEKHSVAFPDTKYVLPVAGPHLLGLITNLISASKLDVTISQEDTSKIMAASDYALICSGTATLQAALAGLPHAVVYLMDNFSWFLATKIIRPLLMDPDLHVAIANVLAIKMESDGLDGPIPTISEAGYSIKCDECGRPLFVPELLQSHATVEQLCQWLNQFRQKEDLCQAMRRGFEQIRDYLIQKNESKSAAKIVYDMLNAGGHEPYSG